MAAIDSSPNTTYPESPMDQEDVVYPCKGCGEILEEGKAFELGMSGALLFFVLRGLIHV